MPFEQGSPINLQAHFEAKKPKSYLQLHWKDAAGFVHHGTHGLEVIFGFDPDNYLILDGKKFALKQFHFHHPSEHIVEGQQYDGELHIVHQNLNDGSLAVLGIMLQVSEKIKDSTPLQMIEHGLFKKTPQVVTDPHDWLPKDTNRFFRYEGSLTTEPFTESVSWIVYPDSKTISTALFAELSQPHLQLARNLQTHNRRYIINVTLDASPTKSKSRS